MRHTCHLPRPVPRPRERHRTTHVRVVLLLASAALLGLTGCATPHPEARPDLTSAAVHQALQATSQHPLRATSQQAFPVPPPKPPDPLVTQPWMDERLRALDDHYAAAAAQTREVFDTLLASTKTGATSAELASVRTSVGQIAAAAARIESGLGTLTTRVRELERSMADLTLARSASPGPPATPTPGPAVTGEDPATAAFGEALTALQGIPHVTQPMRAWIERHPTHPKAPEALLQLGVTFLENGYRTAARHYFQRLTDEYAASRQAAEAQAIFRALTPPNPPGKKPAPATKSDVPETPTSSSAPVPPAPAPPTAPAPAKAAPAPASPASRAPAPSPATPPTPFGPGQPGPPVSTIIPRPTAMRGPSVFDERVPPRTPLPPRSDPLPLSSIDWPAILDESPIHE